METTIKQGDEVQVVQCATSPQEDHRVVGLNGTLAAFTKPHGYALIKLDSGHGFYSDFALVHPENLKVTHRILCSVIGCDFYANDKSDFCQKHF
jgi:hypothetical protein